MEIDALKDVPTDDLPLLLSDLKSDTPNSVHPHSFLMTILQWKQKDPGLNMRILAPEGDIRSKILVMYCNVAGSHTWRGSIHKWSHRNDDNEVIQNILEKTCHIPWNKNITISSMTPETAEAVSSVIQKKFNKEGNEYEQYTCKLYWVPHEIASKWTVDLPEGTYLAHLTKDHCYEIDEVWPHRYEGSLRLIQTAVESNIGIGLFDSKTDELMCWALQWYNGDVGALQTKEAHKRKQYGSLILKSITQKLAEKGYNANSTIRPYNKPSLALMEKIGFRYAYDCTWVQTLAQD